MPGVHLSESTPPNACTSERRAFGGVLVRRERWGLSWRGRFLILLAAAALMLIILLKLQSFLAVTRRAQGDYLVVEGWMHYACFEQASLEFRAGRYKKLLTTGVRRNMGLKPASKDTYAQYAAEQLKDFGMTEEQLQPVPCWVERKDRTYNSALAVKQWFDDNGIKIKAFNVVSEGPHARRTRLLYEQAFGKGVKIGIIAVQDPTYDVDHWWRSSEGVRELIGETIAYAYARILFPILHETGSSAAASPSAPVPAPATNAATSARLQAGYK